jgi:protein-tyrosine phosphatase
MSSDPTGIKIAFDPTVQRMTGVTAHGFISFDVPFITEITPGLWQGGCKNGLILPRFIKHVVSLYPWESYKARHEVTSTLTVRMLDAEDQDTGAVDQLARWVAHCRKTGPVLVHCQAGLNRSSLVAARVLMLDGMSADEAIRLIREKRSAACLCNEAFEDWLRSQPPAPKKPRARKPPAVHYPSPDRLHTACRPYDRLSTGWKVTFDPQAVKCGSCRKTDAWQEAARTGDDP